jgi:hypothetical protein
VLSFVLAMAIIVSILTVVFALGAGAFTCCLSLLCECEGGAHALQYGTTIACNILSGVFGGAWRFLVFLPGFARRNPMVAATSLAVLLVPVLEQGKKELFG